MTFKKLHDRLLHRSKRLKSTHEDIECSRIRVWKRDELKILGSATKKLRKSQTPQWYNTFVSGLFVGIGGHVPFFSLVILELLKPRRSKIFESACATSCNILTRRCNETFVCLFVVLHPPSESHRQSSGDVHGCPEVECSKHQNNNEDESIAQK